METSLAEDVQKHTQTLSPDSFFFMSPYRSFSTSGCFRRFSQPAVGGDALNGEFQQQLAAAFAEARAAGIRKPVMVGLSRSDTCQPSELYIPGSAGKRSLAGKTAFRPLRRAAGDNGSGGAPGRSRSRTRFSHGGTRCRADRHPGSGQGGALRLIDITTRDRVDSGALMERLIAQTRRALTSMCRFPTVACCWAPARSCCCVKTGRALAHCRWLAPPVVNRTMCWTGKRAAGCWHPARSPRARAGDPGDEERAGPAQQPAVAAGIAVITTPTLWHLATPIEGTALAQENAMSLRPVCCTRPRR